MADKMTVLDPGGGKAAPYYGYRDLGGKHSQSIPMGAELEYLMQRDSVMHTGERTPPESWYEYYVQQNYPQDWAPGQKANIKDPLLTLLQRDGRIPQYISQLEDRGDALNPLVETFYQDHFHGVAPKSTGFGGRNAELVASGQHPSFLNLERSERVGMLQSAMSTVGAGAMKALDYLQRGQYGSAKMFDVLQQDGWVAFGKALSLAAKEVYDPTERLSFTDVIKRANPGLNEASPALVQVLGFIGDVVLDPTTYMTFGAGPGMKVLIKGSSIAGKGHKTARLTNEGAEWLRKYIAEGASKESVQEMTQKMFRLHSSIIQGRTPLPKGKVYEPLFEKEGAFIGLKVGGGKKVGTRLPSMKEVKSKWAEFRGKTKKGHKSVDEEFGPGQADFDYAGPSKKDLEDLSTGKLKKDTVAEHNAKVDQYRKENPDWMKDDKLHRWYQATHKAEQFLKKTIGKVTGKVSQKDQARLTALAGAYYTANQAYGGHQSIIERLRNTRLGQAVEAGFIKAEKRVNLAYADAKTEIMGRYALEEKKMYSVIGEIFGKMDQDALRNIGAAALKISDETILWGKAQGDKFKDVIEFHQLPDDVQKRITESAFKEFGLSTKERGAYVKMRGVFNELGATEKEMEMLASEIANYSPRIYNIAEKHSYLFTATERWEHQLFGHNMQRKYATVQDAMKDGWVPEMNAAEMISRRWMASVKARRAQELKNFHKNMLEEFDSAVKGGKKPTFTKRELDIIQNDIQHLGMADTGMSSAFGEQLERGYNAFHSLFRRAATTWRIGFGVRTGVDNLVRMYTLQGAKAAGGFAPETQKVAHAVLTAVKLGDPAMLRGIKYRDGLGQLWTGDQIYQDVIKNNVIQDMATGGVKQEKKLMARLKEMDDTYAWITKGSGGKFMNAEQLADRAWRGGLVNLVKNAHKYWNWSAEIENVSRMTVYLNSLAHGADPLLAAQDVNKVLFDYSKGLTPFEDRWMKKIIPFYTYQRFVFPALAKVLVTNPGQLANTKKGVEAFLAGFNKIYGGEELNESERMVLPGWLLEQPNTYLGMGQDMKAHFAAFNNFTPLDTLGFLEMDETGQGVDPGRTVAKTLFSVLSPAIKMPFEVLMNRNLFTDRVITSTATEQGLEKMADAGVILEGVSAAQGMVPEMISAALPDFIKEGIGFEVVTDSRDGQRKAYVNPYLSYMAAATMPVYRDFIRVIDDKLTPRESAVAVILGVSQYKLDLQQQLTFKQKQYEMMVKSAQAKTDRARKQGRWRTERKLLSDLQHIVAYTSDQWSKLDADKVRGLGFDPQDHYNAAMGIPRNWRGTSQAVAPMER